MNLVTVTLPRSWYSTLMQASHGQPYRPVGMFRSVAVTLAKHGLLQHDPAGGFHLTDAGRAALAREHQAKGAGQ